MAQDPNYEKNVLAHIEMHKTKGETEAVKAHMASPIHRAIVDAAAATALSAEVLADADGDPDYPDVGDQTDPDEGKDKE